MIAAYNKGAADAIRGIPSNNPYGFENRASMDNYNAGYARGKQAKEIQEHQEACAPLWNLESDLRRELGRPSLEDEAEAL